MGGRGYIPFEPVMGGRGFKSRFEPVMGGRGYIPFEPVMGGPVMGGRGFKSRSGQTFFQTFTLDRYIDVSSVSNPTVIYG